MAARYSEREAARSAARIPLSQQPSPSRPITDSNCGQSTQRSAGLISRIDLGVFCSIAIPGCQGTIVEGEGMAKIAGVAFVILLVLAEGAQAQVKIGVAGPLSGPGKAYGTQFKNGASQA